MSKIHSRHLPYPKTLTLTITALMATLSLSACQSIPNTQTTTQTPAVSHTPSASAKQTLIGALSAHLDGERYAVSSSRYVATPMHISDIDKDADPAWITALKVAAFKDNARYDTLMNNEPTIITHDEYLGKNGAFGELPYLRYGDDQNPQVVTRTVGMSDDYHEVSLQIIELHDEIISHLIRTDAREFLDNRGNFNQSSFKKDLEEFDKKINKSANELLKIAQGQQKSDIHHLRSCVADYKKHKLAITKDTKTQAELENILDALYGMDTLTSDCASVVWYDITKFEPYDYVGTTSKSELDTLLAEKHCLVQMTSNSKQLFDDGKNYHTHADDFAHHRSTYHECLSKIGYPYHETPDYRGFSGFIKAYKDMKAQEQASGEKPDTSSALPPYLRFGVLGGLLNLKQTPEQTIAQNIYQYQPLSLDGISHHSPSTKTTRSLYSIDYETPTQIYSAQFPVMFDYTKGEMTANVSALLPLMALIAPKHTPLPKDISNGLVSFTLPQKLHQQIPADVIYDAINTGIIVGMRALHDEKFTATDLRDDAFAKEVGASRVIKITLGSKELGTLHGVIAKHVGTSLHAYVQENPAYYSDSDEADDNSNKIKQLIDDFTTLNSSYRSSDVGGLFQIIEAVLPLSLDGAVYVYLNSSNKIIALQNISYVHDQTSHTTTQSIKQVRYDKKLFDTHLLSRQLRDTFDNTAKTDGTELLTRILQEQKFAKEARYARYDYAYDAVMSAVDACIDDPNNDVCTDLTQTIERVSP